MASSNQEEIIRSAHRFRRVDVGFRGTNAGAERKRFDEATMLSSKMIIEDNSISAKKCWRQNQRTAVFYEEFSITAPPPSKPPSVCLGSWCSRNMLGKFISSTVRSTDSRTVPDLRIFGLEPPDLGEQVLMAATHLLGSTMKFTPSGKSQDSVRPFR